MRMRTFLLPLAIGLTLLTLGCGKSDKSPTQPVDPSATLADARQTLENLLYAQIQSPTSPTRPSDVDLSTAYTKYVTALQQAPANPTANFGVAVLGTMTLAQDAEVNAAFDEWKAYLEARGVPFRAPSKAGASGAAGLGVPLGFASGTSALNLPLELGPASVAALARPKVLVADPRIGRVQAILRDRVLPKLTEAIARLDVVAADPTFTFVVTPRMQGDENETPLEIDHTDVLALRSACQLLTALCDMAVAYDLDFAAYDSTTLVRNFTPGSSWMALTATGTTRMRDAQSKLRDASIGVDSTITSLLGETDDQSDDIIKISPDPAARARLDAVHADLADFRTAILGQWTKSADWDGNSATPDVALTFDLNHSFQHPVADFKALFPAYTASTERRPLDRQWQSEYLNDVLTFDVPTTAYWSGWLTLYRSSTASGFQTTYNSSGPTWMTDVMRARADVIAADILTRPHVTGVLYVSLSFSGNLAPGPQTVPVWRYDDWITSTTDVFVPVITWNAATFAEWTWPDPTLGGLLPNVTTTGQLESLFGMTASGWTRRNVLDWTGAGDLVPTKASARRPL